MKNIFVIQQKYKIFISSIQEKINKVEKLFVKLGYSYKKSLTAH